MSLRDRLRTYRKRLWKYSDFVCFYVYYILYYYWKVVLVSLIVISLLFYFLGFILTFLLIVSFFLYCLYNLCDHLLYSPNCPKDSRSKVLDPSNYGMNNFEQHFITTEDNVSLHVYLLKRASPEETISCPTLIYLHGNAGNIGHRLPNAIELWKKIKCNILLVQYRGYGFSQGSPSEQGLYLDAYAAFKFIYSRNDLCSSKIVLFGRSLGGGVAIGVAQLMMTSDKFQSFKPAAIIVENTFTSIPDISRHLFPARSKTLIFRLFCLIPNWFYKNRFESEKKLSQIPLPTLFISGLSDELIPPKMMSRLFKSSSSSYKELHKFEGGNHNFTWKCEQYYSTIEGYLYNVFHKNAPVEHPPPLVEPTFAVLDSSHSSDEKSPLISIGEEEQESLRQASQHVTYHPAGHNGRHNFAKPAYQEMGHHMLHSEVIQLPMSDDQTELVNISEPTL